MADACGGGQAFKPSAGKAVPDQCRPPRDQVERPPEAPQGKGARHKGRATTARINAPLTYRVISGFIPSSSEEIAQASVSKDEATSGPHGSPSDAKHRPE